jgi:hypothetical protein
MELGAVRFFGLGDLRLRRATVKPIDQVAAAPPQLARAKHDRRGSGAGAVQAAPVRNADCNEFAGLTGVENTMPRNIRGKVFNAHWGLRSLDRI